MGCILDQRHVKPVPYGLFPSDYNGCSWVAVYNALYLLGDEREQSKIAKYFEKYLPLGGLFGMPYLLFKCALKRFGIKFKEISINSQEANVCILWYQKANLKAHYCVAQYMPNEDVFRYINPTVKAQPIEDFLKSVGAVKVKLILLERW